MNTMMTPKEALEQLDEIARLFGDDLLVDVRLHSGRHLPYKVLVDWEWKRGTIKNLREDVSLNGDRFISAFWFLPALTPIKSLEVADHRLVVHT